MSSLSSYRVFRKVFEGSPERLSGHDKVSILRKVRCGYRHLQECIIEKEVEGVCTLTTLDSSSWAMLAVGVKGMERAQTGDYIQKQNRMGAMRLYRFGSKSAITLASISHDVRPADWSFKFLGGAFFRSCFTPPFPIKSVNFAIRLLLPSFAFGSLRPLVCIA